uniref:Uncharacterized protein n=1 Tax=Glossina austeni TaxID=7395 RepID=A0A1A9VDC8_GLOAU
MVAASSRYPYRLLSRINRWWRPGRPLMLSKKRLAAAQLPKRPENIHINEAMSEEINTTKLRFGCSQQLAVVKAISLGSFFVLVQTYYDRVIGVVAMMPAFDFGWVISVLFAFVVFDL